MSLPAQGAGMELPSFGAGLAMPPPGWQKHVDVQKAVHAYHAAGKPAGGHIMDSPALGGRLHVFAQPGSRSYGGGIGSFLANAGRTVVRWLAPAAKAAASAVAPALGDAAKETAKTAAQAALTGDGSLADRLRAASQAGMASAKTQAMDLGRQAIAAGSAAM